MHINALDAEHCFRLANFLNILNVSVLEKSILLLSVDVH